MEKVKVKSVKKVSSKSSLSARANLRKKVARVAGAVYSNGSKRHIEASIKE